MAAGLKRHVQGGAVSLLACLPERENFRVRSSWSEMKPSADDSTLANHDGSNHRIRTCRSLALRRKTKRQGHIVEILGAVSLHCSRGFVAKPLRRHVRRARGARKKGGILETVCRPTEWRARPLAARSSQPGLSQQRIGGCSRNLRKQCWPTHRFLRLPEGVLGAGLARFTDCDAFLIFTLLTRAVAVFLDAAGGVVA